MKMNWKQRLANIFRWKPRLKTKLVDGKFQIEEAFEYGGKKYYHFPDQFQVPSDRMMMALAYYEELAMRIDRSYIEAHTKAMDNLLDSILKGDTKKQSLQGIVQLNMNLKERLELIPLPDYIYRMASVIFFDESESIYTYDYDYNKKKIERWKRSQDMLAFFLRTPLVELIPSLKSVIESSRTYSPVLEKIEKIHRGHLSALS
jgi:hypothetical protein